MTISWNPELNDRILQLQLLARELLWGISVGMQRSKQVSKSIEFVEHQNYQPGDPITSIDWKVYARTDRLMIRRQQAETEGQLVLVLDASGDMASGASGVADLQHSKLGRAITALAALTLYAQKRAEPVGLLVLGGKDIVHHYIPPSRRSVAMIFHTLASVTAAQEADLVNGFSTLLQQLRKRTIIFIASDWMEEPSLWGPALENLAAMQHDIRVLHLFSQNEWDLALPETIRLFGQEDSQELAVDISQIRQDFMAEVTKYRSEISEWAGRSKALWKYAALEEELLFPLLQLVKGS